MNRKSRFCGRDRSLCSFFSLLYFATCLKYTKGAVLHWRWEILFPRAQMAMSGDISVPSWEEFLASCGYSQGCCWRDYHDSPQQQRVVQTKMSTALLVRNPVPKDQVTIKGFRNFFQIKWSSEHSWWAQATNNAWIQSQGSNT